MGATVLLPVHVSAGLPCLEAERLSMLQHATPASGSCSTDRIMTLLLAAGVIYHIAYAVLQALDCEVHDQHIFLTRHADVQQYQSTSAKGL